jgi:hypothetical protein
MLCDDGVLQNLLLGGTILALLRYRRLVLLLLEFATHVYGFLRAYRVLVVCGVAALALPSADRDLLQIFGLHASWLIDNKRPLHCRSCAAGSSRLTTPETSHPRNSISGVIDPKARVHHGITPQQDPAVLVYLLGRAGLERGCCCRQGRDRDTCKQLERARD